VRIREKPDYDDLDDNVENGNVEEWKNSKNARVPTE